MIENNKNLVEFFVQRCQKVADSLVEDEFEKFHKEPTQLKEMVAKAKQRINVWYYIGFIFDQFRPTYEEKKEIVYSFLHNTCHHEDYTTWRVLIDKMIVKRMNDTYFPHMLEDEFELTSKQREKINKAFSCVTTYEEGFKLYKTYYQELLKDIPSPQIKLAYTSDAIITICSGRTKLEVTCPHCGKKHILTKNISQIVGEKAPLCCSECGKYFVVSKFQIKVNIEFLMTTHFWDSCDKNFITLASRLYEIFSYVSDFDRKNCVFNQIEEQESLILVPTPNIQDEEQQETPKDILPNIQDEEQQETPKDILPNIQDEQQQEIPEDVLPVFGQLNEQGWCFEINEGNQRICEKLNDDIKELVDWLIRKKQGELTPQEDTRYTIINHSGLDLLGGATLEDYIAFVPDGLEILDQLSQEKGIEVYIVASHKVTIACPKCGEPLKLPTKLDELCTCSKCNAEISYTDLWMSRHIEIIPEVEKRPCMRYEDFIAKKREFEKNEAKEQEINKWCIETLGCEEYNLYPVIINTDRAKQRTLAKEDTSTMDEYQKKGG